MPEPKRLSPANTKVSALCRTSETCLVQMFLRYCRRKWCIGTVAAQQIARLQTENGELRMKNNALLEQCVKRSWLLGVGYR